MDKPNYDRYLYAKLHKPIFKEYLMQRNTNITNYRIASNTMAFILESGYFTVIGTELSKIFSRLCLSLFLFELSVDHIKMNIFHS